MEEYIIEIWKDIKGYEGYYKVSNYGKIKSLDRYVNRNDGRTQFKKGKIITPILNPDGYYALKLCKDGESKTVRIHQVVAEHFVDKPDDYQMIKYEVNHKDYNRINNHAENLEWLTHQSNVKYSSENGRYKIRDFSGKNNPNYDNHILSEYYKQNPEIAKLKLSRPKQQNGRAVKIELYDCNMNYIKLFEWIGSCAEYLINNGYTKATINSVRSHISLAIKNNKKYLNHFYKKIA